MKQLQCQVAAIFQTAIEKMLAPLGAVAPDVSLIAAKPAFGDYQCNNAMGLFKQYGKDLQAKSPRDIAEKIQAQIDTSLFESVAVAPAGFITVKLKLGWITQELRKAVALGVEYSDPNPKRVTVDFSSPNIAKEMHVGHMRSTILGETICRILESSGHSVARVNHVGDWGTQFGMLIEYITEAFPDFLTNQPEIGDLESFYKAAKKRFDADPEFKLRAQRRVVALQSGEEFARQAWKILCDISRLSFDDIYRRLDISIEEKGESFYNDMIPSVIGKLDKMGLIKDSEGARCLFTSVDDIPLMAVKSDGGFGYDTTDLAAVYHRLIEMNSDWVLCITDSGQENHFLKIFDAAKQAGWHVPGKTRLDHVGFGMVLGEDGKRFRTRSSETVKLKDLLDEATVRAEAELRQRALETAEKGGAVLDEEQLKIASETIGIAAVRYFDMRTNRQTNYVFTYDKMLDPKGNTAVYLLYAYARISSILRQSGVTDLSSGELEIVMPSERALALELLKFPDMINSVLSDLYAHKLTDYMWELSNKFTSFYMECRVMGSPEMRSRLVLCQLTKDVLGKCFYFLGIKPLQQILKMWSNVWRRGLKVARMRDRIQQWKIQVDDRVVINSGKAKGCSGRVLSIDTERNSVKVQNCNLYTARDREGTRRLVPRAVHYSNVNLIDPSVDKPTRIHLRTTDNDELVRVSRKSGGVLPWPTKDVSPTRVKPNAITGPKDTEVEFALEKTYDYQQDVEAMRAIRAGLSKYNNI